MLIFDFAGQLGYLMRIIWLYIISPCLLNTLTADASRMNVMSALFILFIFCFSIFVMLNNNFRGIISRMLTKIKITCYC